MAEKKQGPQEVEATPVEKRAGGGAVGTTTSERRGAEKTRGETFVAPEVDIYEEDDSLVLVADVPGVGAGGVEVSLEGGVLELTAHRAEEKSVDEKRVDEKGAEADYSEYRPVSYHRSFSLSEDIDAEKIAATIKHGVLTVILPKSARAKPRKIEVKAG